MTAQQAQIGGRFSARQLVAVDAVAAVALTFTVSANLAAGAWRLPGEAPLSVAWLLALTCGIPLLLRRKWPVPMLGLALVLWAGASAMGVGWVVFIVIVAVLYTVATRCELPLSLAMLASVIAVDVLTVLLFARGGIVAILLGSAVHLLTWAAGRFVRVRTEHAAQTARRHTLDAVSAERLRIARELHDIVAHGMSVIAVKASVANHVAETNPGEARAALRDIEDTSRDALAELRRMLGVLRSQDDGAPIDPAPAPGGLAALADRAGLAGVRVDLRVDGVDDLADGIGLSVYRIVQEALTNVVRHAAPAACLVVVTAAEGVVTIDVTDDGPGVAHTGPPGHGLIGMRERVAIYDGVFSAGPGPDGGFAVHAELPWGRP